VITAQAGEALAPGRRARLSSPWSPGLSTSIMAADWLGLTDIPVTREQAMKVPAVVAARNIICEAVAAGIWRRYRRDVELPAPVWAYRTDSELPPYHRMLWTVDDVLFTGYGLWQVSRSAKGELVDAVRVPPERWDWDEDWNVLVDEQPAARGDVILFLGWDEGLLITGNETIRAALDLSAEVSRRVRVPQAHTVLRVTDASIELTDGSEDPEDNEQKDIVDGFVTARRSPNGAVSLLPYGIEQDKGGEAPVSLYEQGRNASTLDLARLTGVPATLLEASQTSASLTYETRQGMRALLHERVRHRATVFEARLSMDDVVPRGQRMALDLSHLQPDETGTAPVSED
jgi:hypothetical protein